MAIIGQRKSRATSLRNLRRLWRWAQARANADKYTGNFKFLYEIRRISSNNYSDFLL